MANSSCTQLDYETKSTNKRMKEKNEHFFHLFSIPYLELIFLNDIIRPQRTSLPTERCDTTK
ncbi:hypothetical protein BLOT_005750 [Blomia tropicalis]|nr:hypothetical protein BLOT_005750 [Blomia tropicalis]